MTTTELAPEVFTAIKDLQCCGCVAGPDPSTCPAYKPGDHDDGCAGHVAGTRIGLAHRVHLGMPKGFNKVGALNREMHPQLESILVEANLDTQTIDYIERRLQEEDLVTVPTGQVFLRIPVPWRHRRRSTTES